jgi:histidyl-tRNA synthetase
VIETPPDNQRARGMRDLLPEEMERVRDVEQAFVATCRSWGYREIRTPAIEPLHLFTAAGTLSPQTLERVYSFLDWDGWSGERVVLRPDSTIPAARLYGEHYGAGQVAKLFYVQNVYHFTEDGSDREEPQCGVELIGDTGQAGDVEMVLLALATLEALELQDISVRLSHTGIVRAVMAAAGLSSDDQLAAYDRLLDGDMAVVDEVAARLPQLSAPLRMLFEVDGAGSGYVANVRGPLVEAIPALAAPLDELSFVVDVLEARGAQPVIKAVLARNFEYYSGIIFKIDAGGARVITGGRYDGLLELVAGRSVPASGFGLYVTPVVDRIDRRLNGSRIVVVVDIDRTANITVQYDAARRLRAAGFTVATVRGEDDPVCRLACHGQEPTFTLERNGTSKDYSEIDDVIRALKEPR